jgi:hypothetical protein
MTKKLCPRCEEKKALDKFNKNARRPDGLSVYCKECERARMKDLYQRTNAPDVSNCRRLAFLEALEQITDPDVREEIQATIQGMQTLFMQRGNLKEYAARNQAVEFVAACVWNEVQIPRSFAKP